MKRRQALRTISSALTLPLFTTNHPTHAKPTTQKLGLVIYCLGIRNRYEKSQGNPNFFDPIHFLEHARSRNAGGIQIPIGVREKSYTKQIREKIERWSMDLDAAGGLPKDNNDLDHFDNVVKTAKECGATVLRTVMIPGRRYEEYETLQEFKKFYNRGRKAVERAAPIMEKYKIHLAIENHKEQRIGDLLPILESIDSEYVGVCFDTGNSFALLEDPIEVANAYAPWTKTVHLKDQAVQEYEEGFLFADIKYGGGLIPLKHTVDIVRQANPQAHFNLEMITRDPLKVPCLNQKYWATFPNVPASDLARALRTIRAKEADALPQISKHPIKKQVQIEENNVSSCLKYANEHLGL